MEKKIATKAGKKFKKTSQLKKAPKSPEFIGSNKEEEEPPLLGLKEEAQGFFDSWKKSKTLTLEKRVEKVVFMGGDPMKVTNYYMVHYVILTSAGGC